MKLNVKNLEKLKEIIHRTVTIGVIDEKLQYSYNSFCRITYIKIINGFITTSKFRLL